MMWQSGMNLDIMHAEMNEKITENTEKNWISFSFGVCVTNLIIIYVFFLFF